MRLDHITPKRFGFCVTWHATLESNSQMSEIFQVVDLFEDQAGIAGFSTSFPGGNSEREPPDPISNSEVKTFSADGSVGSPHVRVGHRQDLI